MDISDNEQTNKNDNKMNEIIEDELEYELMELKKALKTNRESQMPNKDI